ncbi:MAG: InlB B-repeat-containing protein, partial [Oscillospiraceae bacterium]|nr:InlB B-repeat-containing protein [Oscillospiraceae bacterium]
PHTYTISFDKNNAAATGSMEDLVLTYDVEQALTKNAFTVENYEFAGWAEFAEGSIKFADGAKVNNLSAEDGAVITLYALWTPKNFNITYHGCDGVENANPTTYNVETETFALSSPAKAGFIFGGWYKNASFTGEEVKAIEKGTAGNLDLYAKWIPRTDIPYRVEHYQENADGEWVLFETENFEGSIVELITPAVKSYEHYVSPSAKSVYISVEGDTAIRYEYERKYYTITLNPGIGTLPEGASSSITAKHGKAIVLPTPEREGYGFNGWFDGNVQFTENVMPTKNITLTAKFTEGQFGFTVNHYLQNVDGNGYTLYTSVTGTSAMDSTLIGEINSYTGFTSPSEVKSVVIGTKEEANVIDYYYTRNQYNLSWNLNGGSASGYTSGKVYYGAAIVAPVPVKTGYSYSWNNALESVMPAYDLSYTAIWAANEYSVVFDVDGGKVVSGSAETRNVTYDSAYGELPVLQKTGYKFEGWFSAKEGGKEITAETIVSTASNHTIYARFSAVTYSITYNGIEGATNENPATYSIETGNITLNAPVKEGFTFEGWYLAEDFSGDVINTIAANSDKDIVLYAKWSENTYTVIFHSNNGEGEATVQENFTYTEEKALDLNTFVREGYAFLGWATNSTASEAEY